VCVDVLLNGVDLGITDNNGFAAFFPSVITNNFVAGSNILVCVVSNAPGSGPNLTAFRAELSGLSTLPPPTPLTLLSAPANTSGYQYQTATFAVTAYGSGPLSSQWFFATNLLASQTNRTLLVAGRKLHRGHHQQLVLHECDRHAHRHHTRHAGMAGPDGAGLGYYHHELV
jgi:hypothetical protein